MKKYLSSYRCALFQLKLLKYIRTGSWKIVSFGPRSPISRDYARGKWHEKQRIVTDWLFIAPSNTNTRQQLTKLVVATFKIWAILQAVASRPVEFVATGCNENEKFTWVQGEIRQVHRWEIIQEFIHKQKQSLAQRFRQLKVAREQAWKEKYLTLILFSMFHMHPLTDVIETGHVEN